MATSIDLRQGLKSRKRTNAWQYLILLITLVAFFLCSSSFAADIGRYQVVSGDGENSYLVDTTSGAVWILTYRTIATGREPIAIPYKFIKLSPKDTKEFIVENIQQEAPFKLKEGE